jgi:uncharacterized phage-associated protein
MPEKQLPTRLQEELERLSLLPESEIDTTDIPEVTDFSRFKRGQFRRDNIVERSYDIRAIANWFIGKFKEAQIGVTNLSLNKIVYFTVERALVENHVLLSPAKIEAWNYGPVFREIYHNNKAGGSDNISDPIKKFDLARRAYVDVSDEFSPEDEAFFESIFQDFGRLKAGRLVDISHQNDAPWHYVWSRSSKVNFGMEITKEVILALAPPTRPSNGRQEH